MKNLNICSITIVCDISRPCLAIMPLLYHDSLSLSLQAKTILPQWHSWQSNICSRMPSVIIHRIFLPIWLKDDSDINVIFLLRGESYLSYSTPSMILRDFAAYQEYCRLFCRGKKKLNCQGMDLIIGVLPLYVPILLVSWWGPCIASWLHNCTKIAA